MSCRQDGLGIGRLLGGDFETLLLLLLFTLGDFRVHLPQRVNHHSNELCLTSEVGITIWIQLDVSNKLNLGTSEFSARSAFLHHP